MRVGPLLLVAVCQLLTSNFAAAGIFTGIGGLRADNVYSLAGALSADGTAVVGSSLNTLGYFEAIRWTPSGGMEGLGVLDTSLQNRRSRAYGVSGDGSVIAGQSPSRRTILSTKGFYWTESDGMEHIPDLPGGGYSGFARGVDDSGTYIAGNGSNDESAADNGRAAYRWNRLTQSFDTIGDLPGDRYFSEARGISGDGSTVVGYSESSNGNEAFRWTESGGIQGLGDLAGGTFNSFAQDASETGEVVVGFGRSSGGTEAFHWTEGGGMVGLGDLAGGGFSSVAYTVSADGTLIGGSGTTDTGDEAFLWDAANGMRRMADILALAGLNTSGWTLRSVEGISRNGMIFTGRGINPAGDNEAWYADMTPVPEPGSWLLLSAGAVFCLARLRRSRSRRL